MFVTLLSCGSILDRGGQSVNFCFDRSVVTLHRRHRSTLPPLDFLLSLPLRISYF